MKIKTVIIEDETNARKALENMLAFYCPYIEVAGYAVSVKEGVSLIDKAKPDLVLLDVHLEDGTGFDVLQKLKKTHFRIVFVTAHDQYALQAIKLSAIDYLLKPIKPEELRFAMSKVQKALEEEEQINLQVETIIENYSKPSRDKKIILNTNSEIFVVEIKHLVHCEANENYTTIYIEGKHNILISKTLKEFEEMLSPYGFFRIHQSHLINLQFVDSYVKRGGGKVHLKTEETLPVSLRKKESFLKALQSYSR